MPDPMRDKESEQFPTFSARSGPVFGWDNEGRLGSVHARGSNFDIGQSFDGAGLAGEEGGAGHYVGTAIGADRIRKGFALVLVAFCLVLVKAGYLQVVRQAHFRAIAEGNRSRTILMPAERGIIYDRNGVPLVRNEPSFSASITADDLPNDVALRGRALVRSADILGIQPADIETRLAEYRNHSAAPVIIKERLTRDQAVLASIESARTPALSIEIGRRRDYATDGARSLSHVTGYLGRVTEEDLAGATDPSFAPSGEIGRAGIERAYDTLLRGEYGRRRIEVDAALKQKTIVAEEDGKPGNGLVLSLDIELQKKAESALAKIGKRRGSVIAIDPRTGEVLALVSMPAYDADDFSGGIPAEKYAALTGDPDRPLFPRAIAGSLPSGSTFKPVVATAALEEGTITTRTSMLSVGGIAVGAWFFPDWKAGGHGLTDVYKALAESVNTFFYALGGGYGNIDGLGVERITAYARKFGFGQPLGLDLPGEGGGFLPSKEWKENVKKERWYIGDTYHIAIGQGDILVTPLQIAAMTTIFANGGTLYRPHLAKVVLSPDGGRRVLEPEKITERVASEGTIEAVRRGMRQSVTAGSARWLADLPVQVAAKTGTAQWNSAKPNHAWFTAFAPYEAPTIVLTVVVEEGGEGSGVGARIAKDILGWYFKE